MTNKAYHVTVAAAGVSPKYHTITIVPTTEVGGSVFELAVKYAEFIKEVYNAATVEVVDICPIYKVA